MNPFDLTGPDFLVLYVVVLIGGSMLAIAARSYLRLPAGEPDVAVLKLSPYEVAYLAGGEILAGNAVIARLVQDGFLKAEQKTRKITILGNLPPDAIDVEQAAYTAAMRNTSGDYSYTICRSAGKSMRPLRVRLEEAGLVVTPAQGSIVTILPGLMILAILVMGIIKIFVGISRDKPVGFLFVLCCITAGIALIFFKSPPPYRSRRGDLALKQLKEVNAALRYQLTRQPDHMSSHDLALSLGLFGVGVLTGSPLADLGLVLSRPVVTPHISSLGGSSGGCGGGGSSCGGGGGGCGGGGCGGCGGG